MFIEIIRNGKVWEGSTQRDREEIVLPGFSCTFIRTGNKICITASSLWNMRSTEISGIRVFTFVKDEEPILLFLLQGPDHERRYLNWKEPLVISGSFPGDLLFSHPLLSGMHIQIFRETHQIDFTDNTFASFHGRIVRGTVPYENGDVISVFGTRIFLQEHFVMVCGSDLLAEEPQPFRVQPEMFEHTQLPLLTESRRPFLQLPVLQYELKLPEPGRRMEENESNVFLSIAPSLMMGGASLSTGLLAMSKAWKEGREMIDALPMILLPAVMLLSAVLWTPLQRASRRRRDRKKEEAKTEQYEQHLEEEAAQLVMKVEADLQLYAEIFPIEETLPSRWMRHGFVRLGTCQKRCPVTIAQNWHLQDVPEAIRRKTEELRSRDAFCFDLPLVRDLFQYRCICVHGKDWKAYAGTLLRRLLLGSDGHDCRVILSDAYGLHDEILYCENLFDDNGKRMFVHQDTFDETDLAEQYRIHLVLFCLEWHGRLGKRRDVTVVCTDQDPDTDLLIEEEKEGWRCYDLKQNEAVTFRSDPVVKPVRLPVYVPEQIRKDNDLASLYEAEPAHGPDLILQRTRHDINTDLKAPIGRDASGRIIELDLHEKADGPHGLIAGTTGSGKSELILTLLCGLALNYSPEDVQFVLIDFKGNDLVQSLECNGKVLSHIAGTLCNLDTAQMDRALIALKKECEKREARFLMMHEICHTPIRSIREYRLAQRRTGRMEPMADLLIVVDEFAELKAERPDFMQDLISIARVGRSLGIHLILSTQKPGGVINDQIRSNTNFKICLRVSDRQDSMEVLSGRDAYELDAPGSFCLLRNHQILKGQCGYVHAPACSNRIRLFDPQLEPRKQAVSEHVPTQLSVLLQILERSDPKGVPQLWMPPLKRLRWRKEMGSERQRKIGMIDDIHAGTYRDLVIAEGNTLVITSDVHEKKNFLRTVLCTLMHHAEKEEEICLIDDLNLGLSAGIEDAHPLIGCFDSQNEDKMHALLRHIFSRHSTGTLTLLISDAAVFRDNCTDLASEIERIFSHPLEYGLRIILFGVSASAVPYRLMSCFPVRFVLHDENLQDIAAIMERKVTSLIRDPGSGMCNDRYLDVFHWYETDEEDLKNAAAMVDQAYGKEKSYHLPCLPDVIDPSKYEGNGIPLGISKETLEWISQPEGLLYVTGIRRKEYEKFQSWYEKWCQSHHKKADAVFLPLDAYQALDAVAKRRPVLFLGKGFGDQYVLHASVRHLKEGEGILFYGFGNEVMKACEGASGSDHAAVRRIQPEM